MLNGEKFQSRAVTLALVQQCSISNLSEIFSYTTMYSNFMLLDRLLFELSCKNMETHTHTHTYTDSEEYSIVAFCKNVLQKRNYYNGSIHLKLEHIVRSVARTSSTLGIVRSRSRSRHDFKIFLHLPQYKLSSPISHHWHKLGSCD